MTLYQASYLFAALLLAAGIPFAAFADSFKKSAFAFLRSTKAAVVFFGGSGLWFLYILSQLGESDFGNIKGVLIAVFGIAGILAFFFLDDFLSVRGLAILTLLLCREFLDAAFMQEPQSRLLMVSYSYAFVVAALYLGALPYRMRDFFEYLYAKPVRARIFGAILCAMAASIVAASLFY